MCDKIGEVSKKPLNPSAPSYVVTTNTSNVSNVGSGGRAILQTAQATIQGHGDSRVRILFNSGSHKAFITRSVVERLGIQPIRREELGIATFFWVIKREY